MRARALYQSEPIAQPYTGNILLTTNLSIPSNAVDGAFMRRYVPMRFTHATDNPDGRIERALEADLGRIFGWLYHLYHDTIKGTARNELWGKDFDLLPEQSQEIRGTLQGGTDGFAGWANQHLTPHDTEQKMRKDVIAQYLLDTQALTTADDDYKKERQRAERQAEKYLNGEGYRTTNNGRVLYAQMTPNTRRRRRIGPIGTYLRARDHDRDSRARRFSPFFSKKVYIMPKWTKMSLLASKTETKGYGTKNKKNPKTRSVY